MTISSTVDVDYHQFFLCGSDANPTAVSSHGDVCDAGPNLIVVHTGIASGPVRIALEIRTGPPGVVDEEWDNSNQATVPVNQPLFISTTLGDVDDDLGPVDLPSTGYLAVRVSVRGRAGNWDLDVDEPSEDYLIEVWPDRGSKDVEVLKSTDGMWTDRVDEAPAKKVDASDSRVADATVRLRGPVKWDPESSS